VGSRRGSVVTPVSGSGVGLCCKLKKGHWCKITSLFSLALLIIQIAHLERSLFIFKSRGSLFSFCLADQSH